MNQDEAPEFFTMLDTTYDLIGVGPAKVISAAAKAMFFEDLQHYPLHLIKSALQAHRVDPDRGRFTPKPADIASQIERRRAVQWVSADEAWAKLPTAPRRASRLEDGRMDYRGMEPPPALLNQITAEALAVAQPLIDAGDDTAARMAFKGAYTRLVERAKLTKVLPKYFVSPGGSYEEQQSVIDEGVRQGLLPPRDAAPALPTPSPAGQARVRALLETMTRKEIDDGTE